MQILSLVVVVIGFFLFTSVVVIGFFLFTSVVADGGIGDALVGHREENKTDEASPSIPPEPSDTRIVSLFFIDDGAASGVPYTSNHQASGAAVGIDARATTFVITTTVINQPPRPTFRSSVNGTAVTGSGASITSGPPLLNTSFPTVGSPSTITQGPSTFEYTGARYPGDGRTVINRCRLTGTTSAQCNLTHIDAAWYTATRWNGTHSTFSYNWTTGHRFGFAPVTITLGVDLMGPVSTAPAPDKTSNRNENAAGKISTSFARWPTLVDTSRQTWQVVDSLISLGAVIPVLVTAIAVAL
jgi:hypothetical protein